MGLGDPGKAVIIVLIITLMQTFISLSTEIVKVKNNWEKYKCNPVVIPFAGIFGHDPIFTFENCIKNAQNNYMSTFLDPIYSSLDAMNQTSSMFTGIFEVLKGDLNQQQNTTTGGIANIGSKIRTILSELNLVFITISDMFGKLGAIVTVIFYMVQSGIGTARAAWKELPGTAIRIIT